MASDLKGVYAAAGQLHNYFDTLTPVDLWRGQKRENLKAGLRPMHPDLLGFTRRDGTVRLADVKTYRAEDGELMVAGCRCVAGGGDYRGVSTFDVLPNLSPKFAYFKLAAGAKIPKGLAVTKDNFSRQQGGYHYTIAPKDTMTFSLFLVWLAELEAVLTRVGE